MRVGEGEERRPGRPPACPWRRHGAFRCGVVGSKWMNVRERESNPPAIQNPCRITYTHAHKHLISLSLSQNKLPALPNTGQNTRGARRAGRLALSHLIAHLSPSPPPPQQKVFDFFLSCVHAHTHTNPHPRTPNPSRGSRTTLTHTRTKRKKGNRVESVFSYQKKGGGSQRKKRKRRRRKSARARARGAALSHPPPPLFILFTRTAASSRGPGSRCDGPSRRRSCT